MKKPIEWHRECLHNMRQSLAREEAALARATAAVDDARHLEAVSMTTIISRIIDTITLALLLALPVGVWVDLARAGF